MVDVTVVSWPNMIFSVTVSGGISMKCWCTMPMPCEMASWGEIIWVGRAIDGDFAFVRLVQTIENIHQSGLAGAIFPQQCVDFPFLQGKIHVVVGEHARKLFGDSPGLESGVMTDPLFVDEVQFVSSGNPQILVLLYLINTEGVTFGHTLCNLQANTGRGFTACSRS